MKKSYFIGPLNNNKHPKGGDQFKNRILYDILMSVNHEIQFIDTARVTERLKLLLLLISEKLGRIEHIVISASSVSSYKFIKLLSAGTRRKTIYFVIGGALPDIIIKNNLDISVYNNLKFTVVEGVLIKQKLAKLGLNSIVLHNFKCRKHYYNKKFKFHDNLRLVFVSRITESKGVLTILEALDILAKESISCTFYGPCDTEMKVAISKNAFAHYGGYLDFYSSPQESYSKLAEYDALVFPTKWHGEGFPGVFLDAFMVGLPVICSDWNMNLELIQDGYNGLVLKENNVDCLIEAINIIYRDRKLLDALSKNSLASFNKYDFETAKSKIVKILN